MALEAVYVQDDEILDFTPSGTDLGGRVNFLKDGRAAVIVADLDSGKKGAQYVEGVFDVTSASGTLFSEGEDVYWDDSANLAVNVGTAAARRIGTALAAKISGQLVVRVCLNMAQQGNDSVAIADSSPVSNTVSETIVGTYTIPANSLRKGSVLEILAALIATATNATDTFQYRVRLGGIGGTVIADTTAIDLANNDVAVIRAQVVVRAEGAAGTFVAASQSISKTTANPVLTSQVTIDTTAAITVVVTITESVASAGNSALLRQFTVDQR